MMADAKLNGPLYEGPKAGGNLGGDKVSGPTGAKSTPDPLGLKKASGK